MPTRKIEVEILGDSTSLERAFVRSSKAGQKFNQQLTGSKLANTLDTQTKAVQGITAAEEELIKVRSRKASSIGPFRLAGVGLAAGLGLFAATQAVRELGSRLETTGEEAFTAEGRIKNMVSALTSGNIVGAVDAISRAPKTMQEAGISAALSAERLAALKEVAEGFPSVYSNMAGGARAFADAQDRVRAITEQAGTASKEAAQDALDYKEALDLTQATLRGLEFSQRKWNDAIVDGKSALVEFKGAVDDLEGPRGPGARAFEEPFKRAGMPTLPDISPSQRRELNLIGKEDLERIPLLQDRLRQLNNQMKAFHGNQEQRLKILTNIRNTEAEIAAIYDDQTARRQRAAEEAARAAEQARARAEQARQLRIQTRTGWLEFGIERAEATKTVKDDVNAWRALEKYLLERIRQEGRTLELVRELWRTRQRIRDLNKKTDNPLAGLQQVSTKKLAGILAAGTGLGAGGRKTLAANISGAQIQPLYVGVNIDGREVGRAVTTQQTRGGKRTAKQTSGRRG